MFTGIVKGRGKLVKIEKYAGLHKLSVSLPDGCDLNLELGASISIDGVCLTVCGIDSSIVRFDVMQETLLKTTLGSLSLGDEVNVERAAKHTDEVGGHQISGHVDCTIEVFKIDKPENNYVISFRVPAEWMPYIFSKGYLAINGASLTVVNADAKDNSFQVWLIPETLRLTTFGNKQVGQKVNLEVDRNTQVIVDTVRRYLSENLSQLIASQK
jgi:riboflavin synthase